MPSVDSEVPSITEPLSVIDLEEDSCSSGCRKRSISSTGERKRRRPSPSGVTQADSTRNAKRELTSRSLELNNVFIFENEDAHSTVLNHDARCLSDDLLKFDRIVSSQSLDDRFPGEIKARIAASYPSSIIPDLEEVKLWKPRNGYLEESKRLDNESHRSQHATMHQLAKHDYYVTLSQEVSEEANSIESADEEKWKYVIKDKLFRGVLDQFWYHSGLKVGTPEDALQPVLCNSEHTWYEAQRLLHSNVPTKNRLDPDYVQLTASKPDYYLSFPIFDAPSDPTETAHHLDTRNFEFERLARLERFGLVASPLSKLVKGNGPDGPRQNATTETIYAIQDERESPRKVFPTGSTRSAATDPHAWIKKNLQCFPWTIVEVKHQNITGPQVHRQVANGCANALAMLANLACEGKQDNIYCKVPPVIGFTFVGAQFRVYVATAAWETTHHLSYFCCNIWSGKLTNLWDAVRLCNVIDRASKWTDRHLRPWIAQRVTDWTQRTAGKGPVTPEIMLEESQSHVEILSTSLVEARQERKRYEEASRKAQERLVFMIQELETARSEAAARAEQLQKSEVFMKRLDSSQTSQAECMMHALELQMVDMRAHSPEPGSIVGEERVKEHLDSVSQKIKEVARDNKAAFLDKEATLKVYLTYVRTMERQLHKRQMQRMKHQNLADC